MKLIIMLLILTILNADAIQECIDNPTTEWDMDTWTCIPIVNNPAINDLLEECSEYKGKCTK